MGREDSVVASGEQVARPQSGTTGTAKPSFDTSGGVALTDKWSPHNPRPGCEGYLHWSDVSPFVHGYLKAMLAPGLFKVPHFGVPQQHPYPAFSLLAPETLATILQDCDAHERAYPLPANDPRRHNRGLNFWRNRQAGMWASSGWPPLTVALNDAGKVVFL